MDANLQLKLRATLVGASRGYLWSILYGVVITGMRGLKGKTQPLLNMFGLQLCSIRLALSRWTCCVID